ncbi:MAG: glycerate kinase [Eubacteriales bacterium]|nr:glycerate kinase [Eubacteriales bacterium]
MKIVIASDSYKGSCTTLQVADAIERGIRNVMPDCEVVKIPVADGGEGTVDALVIGMGGKYEYVEVKGPLGDAVKAKFGILDNDLAVLEMAEASGLTLVDKDKRNPLHTTTFGTGQMIREAMKKGCRKIYVGIGGSATNDGGVGMAQALGVSFKDRDGNEIGFGGEALCRIMEIDLTNLDERLAETEIIVLSDVSNPLCGENGASYVYGPQKGATPDMVKELDRCLMHYSDKVEEKLGMELAHIPGAGAAGGLGAGLMAFCNAKLFNGVDKLLELVHIERHFWDADLVITGEGKMDTQTAFGKAPAGVAKIAKIYKLPVIAIVGSIGEGASKVYEHGIDAIFDIVSSPMSLDEAMENVEALIGQTTENIIRLVMLGGKR